MVEKGIGMEYVMLFVDIDMWKLITNKWKIMTRIKNCHVLGF